MQRPLYRPGGTRLGEKTATCRWLYLPRHNNQYVTPKANPRPEYPTK